ncbi:MAG: hypothetical protein E8D48_10070 [Nitrospira sp.]|nr:MAG: hypothetical protein E8D48_10070 [Nitrospira sp.]
MRKSPWVLIIFVLIGGLLGGILGEFARYCVSLGLARLAELAKGVHQSEHVNTQGFRRTASYFRG